MTSSSDRPLSAEPHTPGPWFVLPSNPLCIENFAGNIGIVNLASASEADARLISAAPDMYELCLELLEWIHGNRTGRCLTDDMSQRLVATIAKVKGKP